MKCDETTPSCLRCTSTGRTCDGYSVAPPLQVINFANDTERRSYQYLREEVLPRISSHYDQPFWEEWILQISPSQPAIRHALMAVASVHESLLSGWDEELPSGFRPQNPFALQQYNQAIGLLTSDAVPPLSTEVMLTACLVFVTLENLLGQFETASKHLNNGLKILRQWRPRTEYERDLIANCFAPFLLRGGTERLPATSPDSGHLLGLPGRGPDIGQLLPIPARFISLQDARSCLHALLDEIFLAIEGLPSDVNLSTLLAYIQAAEGVLQDWLTKFNLIPHRTIERGILRGSLLLRLRHRVAAVLIRTTPFTDETLFDAHLDGFRDILSLCEEFLTVENQTPRGSQKSGYSTFAFTFDFGILPALYITACRCREPSIRRQAIDILYKSHRREGLTNTNIAALLAEQIVFLEESGLNEVRSCADVPRENRIRVLAMHYEPGNLAESSL